VIPIQGGPSLFPFPGGVLVPPVPSFLLPFPSLPSSPSVPLPFFVPSFLSSPCFISPFLHLPSFLPVLPPFPSFLPSFQASFLPFRSFTFILSSLMTTYYVSYITCIHTHTCVPLLMHAQHAHACAHTCSGNTRPKRATLPERSECQRYECPPPPSPSPLPSPPPPPRLHVCVHMHTHACVCVYVCVCV
jgi:hypothetical protein